MIIRLIPALLLALFAIAAAPCPEPGDQLAKFLEAMALHPPYSECGKKILALGDLSSVTNVTREAGCKDDSPCVVEFYARQLAAKEDLPVNFTLAMAWRESKWEHWTDSADSVVKVSSTKDYGLWQINKAWFSKYDREQVIGDPWYNTTTAGDILAWCENYARRKLTESPPKTRGGWPDDKDDFTEYDVMYATYGCYNGGPKRWDRPWYTRGAFNHHDEKLRNEICIVDKVLARHPDRICDRMGTLMLGLSINEMGCTDVTDAMVDDPIAAFGFAEGL